VSGSTLTRLVRRLVPRPRGEYANDGFPLKHPEPPARRHPHGRGDDGTTGRRPGTTPVCPGND
jgi:hypothetical protein